MATEGLGGAQTIEALISVHWDYISTVMDCQYELVDLQKSVQDQGSTAENWASVTVTEDSLNPNDPVDYSNATKYHWTTTTTTTDKYGAIK